VISGNKSVPKPIVQTVVETEQVIELASATESAGQEMATIN
jgi:hypothetical protein